MTDRDEVMEAFRSFLEAAYPWKMAPSRRLKLWSDVPMASRPACFLYEGGAETYSWEVSPARKCVLDIKAFIYLNAKDPNIVGASLINDVLDALDEAFVPIGSDVSLERKTLDGLAYNCRIDGKVVKDPGDLDGDALLILPIKITLP